MKDIKLKNISNFINSYQFFTLPHLENNGCFFICESESEKQEIISSLNFFNNFFFRKNFNFYFNININLILDIIDSKNFFCILTLNELLKKIPPKKEFLKNFISIKINDKFKITDLVTKFFSIGYDYSGNINIDNGQFKNYGDIFDFKNSFDNKLYKIEFLGNCVEKISTIDQDTKKKINELQEINIVPNNAIFDDILRAPTSNDIFINDYFNKNISFTFKENLLSDINSIFPIDNFNNILFIKIFQKINDVKILENYESDFSRIKMDFDLFINEKYTINLFTFDKNKLTEILKSNNILSEYINFFELKNEISFDGFIDKKNKNIFICDDNIFKKTIINKNIIPTEDVKPKNKNQRIKTKRKFFLQEIKLGDYVVHMDHGVGIFGGIIKNKIFDNIEKEYILINYDGDDKIYVPIESIDKVDKYIGQENPRIQRLSETVSWKNKRQKIKEDIFKYANELVSILAAREISAIKPMEDFYDLENELSESFEHIETEDQLKAINDINKDLKSGHPMDRLICGDVGFGKTEIAVRAAFKSVVNGYQVMILCPTTILSQQHFDTFSERLKQFGIKICLVNRFRDEENKKNNVVQDIAFGKYDIIIGTHRLLSKDISFNNLGLIVVDEEQKFGSLSKERLKKYRNNIHMLAMSATPIPRTLNMSLSGIYNMSIINTPPKDRMSILTYVEKYNDDVVKNSILREIERGGQCYYLYNKVETIDICQHRLKKILPNIRFAVAHGQMHSHELIQIFEKFDKKEVDVLICTTIIESGIDLPNVNTLIVENADRFGLAQLHQLRGRVGRSNRQGYAYFLYKNEKITEDADKRLEALIDSNKIGDGFKIASRDMEIRGVGNLLGKEQHGSACMIGLNLYSKLLEQAINKINNGVEQDIEFETKINVPIDFKISQDYISSESERMQVYQKLSMIDDVDELEKEIYKIKNKDNKNNNIDNLLNIFKLKIYCRDLKITQIDYSKVEIIQGEIKEKISLTFEKENYLLEVENEFYKQSGYFVKKEKILKIDISYLGKNWFTKLVEIIENVYNSTK